MAHKKAGGSSRNGRDSEAKRLGVKRFDGQALHVVRLAMEEAAAVQDHPSDIINAGLGALTQHRFAIRERDHQHRAAALVLRHLPRERAAFRRFG